MVTILTLISILIVVFAIILYIIILYFDNLSYASKEEHFHALTNGFTSIDEEKVIVKQGFASKYEYDLYNMLNEFLNDLYPGQELEIELLKKKIKEVFNNDTNINDTLIDTTIIKFLQNNTEFKQSKISNRIVHRPQGIFQSQSDNRKSQTNQSLMIKCPNCFEFINKSHKFCPECGYNFIRCQICKGILESVEITCPNCNQPFHLSHWQEYFKVKGICPNCGK